ncbi:putative HTH-type transcriptional regulator ywbI [Erwinia piriflorinigrans CFBP 5888]|uniref:Putative HTH-type transcriptional regulator ywbI n=1 Tax=Erwinia piriflorinigrans CFBP 5888 TaxID=1161919 RepID=V5Z491_9GAMM|nr:putative HTH-type transcriptional regulator ywbI [Erwinia piriflorinigrans CFBP 5888]
MKITLEELRAWVVVVDSGSITAAADQLNQTTSGISRALSRLESKLQTTLLHRTTRRIALSEEGQIFLQHARQIIRSVEAAEEQIASGERSPPGGCASMPLRRLCYMRSCRLSPSSHGVSR